MSCARLLSAALIVLAPTGASAQLPVRASLDAGLGYSKFAGAFSQASSGAWYRHAGVELVQRTAAPLALRAGFGVDWMTEVGDQVDLSACARACWSAPSLTGYTAALGLQSERAGIEIAAMAGGGWYRARWRGPQHGAGSRAAFADLSVAIPARSHIALLFGVRSIYFHDLGGGTARTYPFRVGLRARTF